MTSGPADIGRCCDHLLRSLDEKGWALVSLGSSIGVTEIEALENWILSLSRTLGFVVPQGSANNLVARISDKGKDYSSHSTRGHDTNAELRFHSDRCDVNVLLYVRAAAAGGEVRIVTYEAAATWLSIHEPEAAEVLFGDFPVDLRDERIFDDPKWHCRPVLWRNSAGAIRGHYIRRFIMDSQRHANCPRLTPRQLAALDAFDRALAEFGNEVAFTPSPGDLLALNNYRVMHARTQFTDDLGAPRLALRTWVAPYTSEPLPDCLMPLAGSCEGGVFRGGVGMGPAYRSRLGSRERDAMEQT